MKKIFLCGPIENVNKSLRLDWRVKATNALTESGFEVITPVTPMTDIDKQGHFSNQDIFDFAINNLKRTDIVLADVRYLERENTGTAAELMYAHMLDIPIIGWMDKVETPRRVFINVLVKQMYYNLEEAILAVQRYYEERSDN